jgi:2-keto-4-pentenoate hydratase/2-oxohepta-3-ene-1,7-dioic acid hydratase in catechol pathway
MKIICIGRNYVDHAKELNNPLPEKPIFFMKPDTSLLRNNQPFYHPDFSSEVHYEVEVILRINRVGKNIERKFAHRYYGDVGLGIDFTARDLQRECREKGLPWEMAKGFDGSAVIGNIVKKETFEDVYALDFSLWQNDKTVQTGNTKNLIFSFDEIIAYVSQFLTLKIGDLIFTGTPAGVGPVKIGDKLTGFIQDTQMFTCDVK